MFEKNFYPTPDSLIAKMVSGIDPAELKRMNILEPSAGSGSILDYLVKNHGVRKEKVWACEINHELVATLKGKNYKVLAEDFLGYSGALDFNLILMNPPFDEGAKHFLKAWKILRSGHLVAIVNAETIKNPFTQERIEMGQVIEDFGGSVEFVEGAFADAARKTNVEVAVVKIKKAARESFHFSGQGEKTEFASEFNPNESSQVEVADWIRALTRSYSMAIESVSDLYSAIRKFTMYCVPFCSAYEAEKMIGTFATRVVGIGGDYTSAHNELVNSLQVFAWNKIFRTTKADGLATREVQKRFDEWRVQQGGMDLNEDNVLAFFDQLIALTGNIFEQCVEEVFDRLTQHAWSRQREVVKFKTNSAFGVQKKVIIPSVLTHQWSGGGMSVGHYDWQASFIDDVDRVFCWLSGKPFSDIQKLRDSIRDSGAARSGESTFFKFKCYSNCNLHLEVKDGKLLDRFNASAAKIKGLSLPATETFKGKPRRGGA